MASYRFVTLDVFTTERFGGNPLAVFPEAQGISDRQMQALAREFNYSETTFVLPPEDPANTARVRIFTPAYEMPFAGHPNVGTGYVLAREGRAKGGLLRFEEIAGLVEVQVDGEVTTVAAPQTLSTGETLEIDHVAACAGIDPGDVIATRHPPLEASVGTKFFIAELTGTALTRAVPSLPAAREVQRLRPHLAGRFALHLYARDGERIRARMFAPTGGVPEDPATGSANVALGGLLLSLCGETERSFEIVQGIEMGRPSQLQVRAWRAADGIRASVGGNCVPVLRGEAAV